MPIGPMAHAHCRLPTGACPLACSRCPRLMGHPQLPLPDGQGRKPHIFCYAPYPRPCSIPDGPARCPMAHAQWHLPDCPCPIAPVPWPLSDCPCPIAPARWPLPSGPGPWPYARGQLQCPMPNGQWPLPTGPKSPTNCQLTRHSLQVVEVLDLQEQCIDFFSASLDSMLMKMDKILEERDSFRALLLTQYQEGQNDLGDISRRQVVKSLIGDGWDMVRNEEDFNYARKKTLACIKGVCGTDLLKQQQLAEAMYLRYARCTSHLLITMFLTC